MTLSLQLHESQGRATSIGRLSVGVVICAYTERRWDQLVRAVESVCAQRESPASVVVVVDHNRDLFARVRRRFPAVTSILHDGVPGAAAARNAGVARLQTDVVAFLDDDAEAGPGWLADMLAHYDEQLVLAVGGSATPVWPESRPRWFPPEYDWVVGCSYRGMPEQVTDVRNLWGCNMSVRRDAFVAVGGFREDLGRVARVPLGCEETELCIRIGSSMPGGRVVYDPAVNVRHNVSDDRTTWRYFRRRCYLEGWSKALMSSYVGRQRGLSDERGYVLRTLTAGVVDAVGRGDSGSARRAAAIVAGVGFAGAGFVRGSLATRPGAGRHRAAVEHPVAVGAAS
jgi:GT2 family glycosyltransferase